MGVFVACAHLQGTPEKIRGSDFWGNRSAIGGGVVFFVAIRQAVLFVRVFVGVGEVAGQGAEGRRAGMPSAGKGEGRPAPAQGEGRHGGRGIHCHPLQGKG